MLSCTIFYISDHTGPTRHDYRDPQAPGSLGPWVPRSAVSLQWEIQGSYPNSLGLSPVIPGGLAHSVQHLPSEQTWRQLDGLSPRESATLPALSSRAGRLPAAPSLRAWPPTLCLEVSGPTQYIALHQLATNR